ncbi:MAG: tRNA (N(6)-L-threonylcarbamoyladenosine(37)-C(2))-methylthiotransferase MtaB [Clostridia bacterium]|nr:tRNA (N(6)-L-threonylcarbamoyladenosine(37)-C(2))-methylthiotransferase MtaB [Clostridia bacterium]
MSRKAAFLTLGCRVNQYESEALSEALEALGYTPASFSDTCDLYVINTCAVTEESVRKSRQMVRRAVKKNPEALVCVCGCAAQLEPETFAAIEGVSFVCGTRNKEEIVEAVKNGCSGRLSVKPPEGALSPTRITKFDRTRAYVKIQDGCDGKCAYCVIPRVRGGIVLRDEEEIVSEVKALAEGGCREVVLTGIETASYGKGLVSLLTRIAAIDGIERIRMGSLEPSFLKPAFVDAIAAIPKVCPHFHLSVQNGSDDVLRRMRRKYNTAMLTENALYIRQIMPQVNFSADVIVGFPGETEEDFAATCETLRRIGFLHLHIFTYSKRPDTEAATLPNQVPETVKTDRLHRLESLAEEMKREYLDAILREGKPLTVLAETVSDGYLTGHTESFVECGVELPTDTCADGLKGTFLTVTPVRVEKGLLICRIAK